MRSRKYLALASSVVISLSAAHSSSAASPAQGAVPTQESGVVQTSGGSPANRTSAVNAAVSVVTGQLGGAQIPGGGAPPVPGAGLPGAGLPPAGLPAAGLPGAAAVPQGAALPGAAPAALTPQRTIWGFLGLPPTFSAMGTSVHSKCAHVKATLETTPLYQMAVTVAEPMLALVGLNHGPPPIGSDALVNSPNPAIKDDAAVQEANAIKQQEDAAPAKIAAIKYLAGVDCKCYLGVKPALLKALIDCNEGVRFEAAKALGSACCCDKEVAQILDKRANGRDDFGNYIEWSPRVRAAAAQSAAACAGLIPPNGEIDGGRVEPPPIEPPPIEPPPRPQAKRGLFQRDQQEVVIASQPAPTVVPQKTEKRDSPSLVFDRTRLTSTPEKKPETPAKTKVEASPQVVLRHDIAKSEVVPASRGIAVPASSTYKETPSSPATKPAVHLESIESKEDAVNTDLMGMVTYVDTKTGSVRLSFTEGEQPRAGLRAEVFHKFLLRTQHIGELEIIGSSEGAILARPTGELTIRQLSKGDRVVIHQ